MKKHLMGLASLAVVAGAGMPTVASAEILGNKDFSANFAVTTNYYFRGFTQNDDAVTFQAGLDYAHESGFYVGIWGSEVDEVAFNGASSEIDIYGGWAGSLGPVDLDVGYLRYNYPGENPGTWNDTNEWHIGVSHDFGVVAAGLTFYRSEDFFGFEEADYWDFSLDVPINDNWAAHAHYGVTDFDKNKKVTKAGTPDSYKDASIGVATSLGPFGVDLTATNTSGVTGGCGSATGCQDAVILTFSLDL